MPQFFQKLVNTLTLKNNRMLRLIARVIFIFGIVNFCSTARSPYRLFLTDLNVQESLNDEMIRETLLNSLTLVKDDRGSLTTVLDPTFTPEKDVAFHLFTRGNPDESYILKLNDTENLQKSNFNAERKTKIIVHGWTDSGNSYWVKDMRKNYLSAGDYNVILVDWWAGSIKEYFIAARLTRQVGEYLGDLLEYMRIEAKLSFPDVHILGHSLGAHIAGYAGQSTGTKIGRISGLDPARPAFEAPIFKGQKDQLDPSDAQFVDVIHSCAGTAGIVRAVGHVDFYPNGGTFRQPGCSTIASQYCSHGRSHQFMTESILGPNEFVAIKCDSWTDYKAGKCEGNVMATMGEYVDEKTRGKYYLETNSETPFAKGTPNTDSQD